MRGNFARYRNKYGAVRTNGYASKHEAEVAAKLHHLEDCAEIHSLRKQVRFTLVEGVPGCRGIEYVADFVYLDDTNHEHVCDAKGFKTDVYKLKKRMMKLLLGIEIEEL